MACSNDDVILEGEFLLVSKKRRLYKVTLTCRGLFFTVLANNSTTYEEKSLQISDIIGCRTLEQNGEDSAADVRDSEAGVSENEYDGKSSPSSVYTILRAAGSTSCGFVVFAYPFRKKMFSGKRVRHRQVVAFEVPATPKEVFEDRKREVEQWQNVINCLVRDIPINVKDIPSCVPPPREKLLFLINPHSGPGKAYSIFNNEVVPMLYEASIPYKAILTDHAGHASELMKSIQLSEWYGVVIVSGDGLIFESINGIMQRDDWASSVKTPIGCIPGGSGNAMCCAINYAAGEPFDSSFVLHSTFVLVKHKVVPMDLVAVNIPDRTIFSCLSVTWGIVADIDFESEKYRNLGEARFTVGAIKRILRLRTYRGRISFLPVAEYTPKESVSSSKVLSKVRRFSLRSQSSSKNTLNSQDSCSSLSSVSMVQHSYSMNANGYSEAQLRHVEGKAAAMNDNQDAEDGHVIFDSSGDEDDSKLSNNLNTHGHCQEDSMITSLKGKWNDSNDNGTTPNVVLADIGGGDADREILNNKLDHSVMECPSTLQQPQTNVKSDASVTGNLEISLHENRPPTPHIENSVIANDSTSTTVCLNAPNAKQTLPLNSIDKCRIKCNTNITVLSETQEIKVKKETYCGHKADFAPVPTPLLPPIDQELPSNWVSLDGEFVLMAAVYQTHLGRDMLVAPDAHLCDGHIHLMMVREGIPKNVLLNLFFSFGEGSHVHSPHVEAVKVLAFRLEPATTNGNIMVDGERFDPTPLQAQILPGLAKVMAIK